MDAESSKYPAWSPTAPLSDAIASGNVTVTGGVHAPVEVPMISNTHSLLMTHFCPVKVMFAEPVVVTVNDDQVPIKFMSLAVNVWPTTKLPRVVTVQSPLLVVGQVAILLQQCCRLVWLGRSRLRRK